MQFVSILVTFAMTGSALAAPTSDLQKRSNTCGQVGVAGSGTVHDDIIFGKGAIWCSQNAKTKNYQSWSFHHSDNSCTFYNQPVSSLKLGSDGNVQIFYDTACGDYSPSCAIQISSNADNTLSVGQQYAINKLDVGYESCVSQCSALANCYALAVDQAKNECFLYSQTTAYISSISPSLSSGQHAMQMSDIDCYHKKSDLVS